MKKRIPIGAILSAIMIVAAFVVGVGQGYDLGADTMECVLVSVEHPDNAALKEDACENLETLHSTSDLTFRARMIWLKIVDDEVKS